MAEYIVVGGGITGLAAAWEFCQAGHEVTVLEDGPRVGGKVATQAIAGYLVEAGPDSVVSYRPAALQLAAELGLGDSVISAREPRTVHLRVAGRLRPMPQAMGLVLPTRIGPFIRTPVLGWAGKLRAATDLVRPRTLGTDDQSVGELLRARLGRQVVERIAEPLLGGVYGASVDELSLDSVVPSLRAAEADHRSLILASLATGRANRRGGRGEGSPFRSLSTGMGSLVDALATGLGERGAQLLCGQHVTSLVAQGAGMTVITSDGTRRSARGVVLACGGPGAARLLAGTAPAAASALSEVPQGSTTVVSLGYDAAAFVAEPVGHGHLEAGPKPAPVSGVTISSNKWPGRAPAGKVLLRAFCPDRVGWPASATDGEILAAVTKHLSGIYGISGPPEVVDIRRWRDCMPKYVVGHGRTVERVSAALTGHPALRVAGSALKGVGVPDCIADGRRAAQSLVAGPAMVGDPIWDRTPAG